MSQRYLGGVITANPTAPTMTTESGVWTLEQQFQYSNVWSPKIVGNSVRLRSSASAYFNRTPASASNQKTWTWSGWVKRGALGANQTFFNAGNNGFVVRFNITTDYLEVYNYSGAYQLQIITSQVFRDPSAWYHIVVVLDTTQATSSNRAKVYVNGSQVTSFGTATYPSQNADLLVNGVNTHAIGVLNSVGQYFDGYLAEVNFIDGQALTPSSFGAFDTNGIWQPLPYTGTYGTNGFYLTFADNSGATATTLGKDYSGNGNNWTPNNISVTSGATYDWMLDTPTNSDNGGTGRGNYAVLNPLSHNSASVTLSAGNLNFSGSAVNAANSTFAYPSSGKWYCEFQVTSAPSNSTNELFGIGEANRAGYVSRAYGSNGQYYNGSAFVAFGSSWSTNDVVGIAADIDNSQLSFYKNGTLQGSAQSFAFPSDSAPMMRAQVGTSTFVANFGQRPFAYTPPTGFKALNTQNLPAVTINNGAQYMAATTYTGTGSALTVSNGANNTIGTTFQPDLIWAKPRSVANWNALWDSVRGANNLLYSNATNADDAVTNLNMSVNSTGWSMNGNNSSFNPSGATIVGWQWKAGGTAVSNTDGSITSSVSANTTAGFSVVTYTGTGANATVGHGLGSAPKMVIVKRRSAIESWQVYHASLTSAAYCVQLNGTSQQVSAPTVWNSTAPTSSVFSVGTDTSTNASTSTYVAYCFAEVAGYSKFDSYINNSSTDGPFVYLGFKPRFVMIKYVTAGTADWMMFDSSRNPYNVADDYLRANLSNAEASKNWIDLLSNGFKIRNTDATSASINYTSGTGTFIYAAFAENPFNISRAS